MQMNFTTMASIEKENNVKQHTHTQNLDLDSKCGIPIPKFWPEKIIRIFSEVSCLRSLSQKVCCQGLECVLCPYIKVIDPAYLPRFKQRSLSISS